MLFDLRPKEDKKELFGREQELKKLLAALTSDCPLILLLGIRRVGKTSLLKVALKECGQPHIYLDLRTLAEEGYSKVVLYRLLSEELSHLRPATKLRELLRTIRGIGVYGVKVELDWGRGGAALSSLFKALNEWAKEKKKYLIMALDEAQLLRCLTGGKGRIDFKSLLAYSYDNLSNLKFILTGSEVGLLMDFIGADDPKSPLYGRYREEVILERFDRRTSIEFLKAGFKERGLKVGADVLRKVVEKLDGIVGWLTYYGYEAVKRRSLDDGLVEEVFTEAKKIAEKEVEKVVQRSRHYRFVLKALGLGDKRWTEVKRTVEAWHGRPISNTHLTRLLEGLAKLGMVEKLNGSYHITDPIIRGVAKDL